MTKMKHNCGFSEYESDRTWCRCHPNGLVWACQASLSEINLTEAKLCFPDDSSAICFDVLTCSGKMTEDLFHLLRREKHAYFKAHCWSTCKWNGSIFSDLLYMRAKKHLWSSHGLNEERYLAFRHIKGLCPAASTSPQLQYAHHST